MIGSAYGTREYRRFTFTGNVNLHAGLNKISLLSIAVGLAVSSLISIFVNFQYLVYKDNFVGYYVSDTYNVA